MKIIRCKGCGAPKSKPHSQGCSRPTGKPRMHMRRAALKNYAK